MSKKTLEGECTAVNFTGRKNKKQCYVQFTIAEDSGKKTVAELYLDILKNPFEESKLQRGLVGEKVTFKEKEKTIPTVGSKYTQTLYIKSGQYKGIKIKNISVF